jgi:hypothetical protein
MFPETDVCVHIETRRYKDCEMSGRDASAKNNRPDIKVNVNGEISRRDACGQLNATDTNVEFDGEMSGRNVRVQHTESGVRR